jgi:hypothetical protein
MWFTDSAAERLRSRLEEAGVPAVIGHIMGQCAYVSEGKRHPNIPTPIIHKTEITWLTDQYVKALRREHEPLARAALIHEFCWKVFGPTGGRIFRAGYPELAQQAAAVESRTHDDDDDDDDAEMWRYRSAARYTGYTLHTPGKEAQLPCYLPVPDGNIIGFLIILCDTIGFYDLDDLAVADPAEGTPLLAELNQLTGCSITAPKAEVLEEYKEDYTFIEVSQGNNDALLLQLTFGENSLLFATPFRQPDQKQQQDFELDLDMVLELINKQLARNYANS